MARRQGWSAMLTDARGAALIIAGFSMPLLIGGAGLAADTIQWALWKRQLQQAADSGAIAGVYAKAQDKNVGSTVKAHLKKDEEVLLFTDPLIENAPTVGPHAGDATAVRVVLEAQRRLPFTGIFMASAPTISAQATAALVLGGSYCVLALENTGVAGITMEGGAKLDLRCGMATNSLANNAVAATGSSVIVASPVTAMGGIVATSNYQGSTRFEPYSVKQIDPFADLPTPAVSGCSALMVVEPNQTKTLSPGCFKGMELKGNVTLSPGTYFVDGGTFRIGSQAVISGTGVTIVLTSAIASSAPSSIATMVIDGGATVNLSAPSSGTYEGVLFYQDRRAVDSIFVNYAAGDSASSFEGALYFPKQPLRFTGSSGNSFACVQIVARRVTFIGETTITNVCPSGPGPDDFEEPRVRLVA